MTSTRHLLLQLIAVVRKAAKAKTGPDEASQHSYTVMLQAMDTSTSNELPRCRRPRQPPQQAALQQAAVPRMASGGSHTAVAMQSSEHDAPGRGASQR